MSQENQETEKQRGSNPKREPQLPMHQNTKYLSPLSSSHTQFFNTKYPHTQHTHTHATSFSCQNIHNVCGKRKHHIYLTPGNGSKIDAHEK